MPSWASAILTGRSSPTRRDNFHRHQAARLYADIVNSETPWLEPSTFDSSPASFREHADAITRMMRGEARLWLGPFARPTLIGPLARPGADGCDANDAPTANSSEENGPCAGCTCALANTAVPDPEPQDIALVLPTSGSTGAPKSVAHSLQSVKASIHASAHYLEGHGAWLPLLPPTHIAGIQVVARAALAAQLLGVDDYDGLPGTLGPVPDLSHSFGASTLRDQFDAWDARPGGVPDLPLFTSLVPTQLERLVNAADTDSAVADDLRRFSAILVGGAAISQSLLKRARGLGARIVTTYGSSETAGGCVYDGVGLRGTELKISDEGRLMITTPSLALGYLYSTGAFINITGNDEATRRQFFRMPEFATTRLFLTSDLAQLSADPATGDTRVRILGRADDVINSGGKKIVPQAIEAVLADTGEYGGVLVVGVPSDEWGEEAVGLIVPKVQGARPTHTWRADLSTSLTVATAITAAGLERSMIPRRVLTVGELPLLPSGKVDRKAGAELAREAINAIAEFDAAKRTATFADDDDDTSADADGGER